MTIRVVVLVVSLALLSACNNATFNSNGKRDGNAVSGSKDHIEAETSRKNGDGDYDSAAVGRGDVNDAGTIGDGNDILGDGTGDLVDQDGGATGQGKDVYGDVTGFNPDTLLDVTNNPGDFDAGLLVSELFNPLLVTRNKVDIVFVIDSSSTMGDHIIAMQDNLDTFVKAFVQKNYIDFTVTIIAGENDNAFTVPQEVQTDPRFQHIDPSLDHPEGLNYPGGNGNLKGVGSNNGLGLFADYMNGLFAIKKFYLRPDAVTEAVFVTDDEGDHIDNDPREISYQEFVTSWNAGINQWGEIRFNGFLSIDKAVNTCWVRQSTAYIQLAQKAGSEGYIQELCPIDFSVLLNDLADNILSRLGRGFKLTKGIPQNPGPLFVEINGVRISENLYAFDLSNNTLFIAENYPLNENDEIVIIYMPAP
jgi:hypothetical protein